MDVQSTRKHDPFKVLVDFQKRNTLQELHVVPSPLNYAIFFEDKPLARLSRRLGIQSWVLESGKLDKYQVDLIGAAIESHYL